MVCQTQPPQGVFPLKRTDEEPKRQFAGEGPAERTNARFHYVSKNDDAKRLSTAFDSVTLYGRDPDARPGTRARAPAPPLAHDC